MREWVCCHDESANHQPIAAAHSCSLLNHLNSVHRGMFKLNAKFYTDSLLYSLSHFECDSHTVHVLKQQRLPPPLTSTVKLSMFTHAHSSPLSLAARLHCCQANCSYYVNNGWTFFLDKTWVYKDWPHKNQISTNVKIRPQCINERLITRDN